MWLAKAHTQWSITVLLAISLAGCTPSVWSKPGSGIQPVDFASAISTIVSIKQAPQVNASVQIKGRVSSRAPLLGKTLYELQDQTGSIWVLATDPIPTIGDEVVLKGKLVYRSISLNGRDQGALYIEQQQLQSTPALKSDRAHIRDNA
jgi:hypothetical protein